MAAHDDAHAPVPTWGDLPEYAQNDLASRGYHQTWYSGKGDDLRLTVLTLYVKLSGMKLWRFVRDEWASGVGCLQFHATSVAELKATLTASPDFVSPEASMQAWSSREMRSRGQLHFKHFAGNENDPYAWHVDCVQAHIDREGLLLHSPAWWLLPVVPLVQMAAHGVDYCEDGYKDVWGTRKILLEQGWDPAPLLGAEAAKRRTQG